MQSDKTKVPVVILAAGEARRLRPLSNVVIKPIIPINGIPLIHRIIQNYYSNGFTQFYIVLSKEENDIQKSTTSMSLVKNGSISIQYCIQDVPKGMADAIFRTYDLLKKKLRTDDFFFVSAADVIFEDDTPTIMYNKHSNAKSDITLSAVYSEDPNMSIGHGNITMDNTGRVTKIVEKPGPDHIIGNYYSMPVYTFSFQFLETLRSVRQSQRGEFEVQDAIQDYILKGRNVVGVDILPRFGKRFKLTNIGSFHVTFIKDFLSMNFRFLTSGGLTTKGEVFTSIEPVNSDGIVNVGDSVLLGPNVYIGKNCTIGDYSEISNSILMGNNIIGKRTIIENAIIGPDVYIDDETKVEGALLLNDDVQNKTNI
jgi:NDP-sugar pyrophosphorylase family protein